MTSVGSTTWVAAMKELAFHLQNKVHRHNVEESYRGHSYGKKSNLVLWLLLCSLLLFVLVPNPPVPNFPIVHDHDSRSKVLDAHGLNPVHIVYSLSVSELVALLRSLLLLTKLHQYGKSNNATALPSKHNIMHRTHTLWHVALGGSVFLALLDARY